MVPASLRHHDVDLQSLWDNAGRVLQVKKGRKYCRPVRTPRKRLERSVYTTYDYQSFRLGGEGEAVAPALLDEPMPALLGDDGVPEGGHDADACVAYGDDDLGDEPQGNKLFHQFYQEALKCASGAFLSTPSHGDVNRFNVYQLLAFKPQQALLKSFRRKRRLPCRLSVLQFETWADRGTAEHPEVEVVALDDPKFVDLSEMVAVIGDRDLFWRWEEAPCDTEGRVRLVKPCPVSLSGISLKSKHVPVLCLMDELVAQGWSFVDRICRHSQEDVVKEADNRTPEARRYYYQCLLCLNKLWDMGMPSFRSSGPQGFYLLLLHGKVAGLERGALRRRVAELEGDPVALQALACEDRAPVELALPPLPGAGALALMDVDGVLGEEGILPLLVALPMQRTAPMTHHPAAPPARRLWFVATQAKGEASLLTLMVPNCLLRLTTTQEHVACASFALATTRAGSIAR